MTYPGEELEIARTAARLRRRYGAGARSEALVWARHFASVRETEERRVWTRIALAVREAARRETVNDNRPAARA